MAMKRIYEQDKDLHTRKVIFYGKAADSKLYYEAAYTNQVSQADLEDAFLKGMLLIHTIANTTVTYRVPTELTANKVKTLTATTASSTVTPAYTEWEAAAAE